MASTVVSFVRSLLWDNKDVSASARETLKVMAVPGLMTLLDTALFRTVEGELTATICTSHALLGVWLDTKHQANSFLQDILRLRTSIAQLPQEQQSRYHQLCHGMEKFARLCFDAACDAIEAISTDKLAQSANLTDPYESLAMNSSPSLVSSSSSSHHHQQSLVTSSLEDLSPFDRTTGRRRYPLPQRSRDCWESPRLHCIDYVWADDAAQLCQRLLRNLYKQPLYGQSGSNMSNKRSNKDGGDSFLYFFGSSSPKSSPFSTSASFLDDGNEPEPSSAAADAMFFSSPLYAEVERSACILLELLQTELPSRLLQFRTAVEAEAVVSKRLYLIKCEYRAPFRAFLEAHQSILRAPSLTLVEEYHSKTTSGSKKARLEAAKDKLKSLLEHPDLVEALALEKRCEEYELEMTKAIYPFSELSRFLEQKRARINDNGKANVFAIDARLRSLKSLSCRKVGPDTATGIRPLLLDLQGIPRDEDVDNHESDLVEGDHAEMDVGMRHRLENLIQDLETLGRLCETNNAFLSGVSGQSKTGSGGGSGGDVDIPSSIVRGCAEEFDAGLFSCYYEDWYAMIRRQHELVRQNNNLEALAEDLRRAEMSLSLAAAPPQSLQVIKERVEMITTDRNKRLEVLKEMIEEVCLREMNLQVVVTGPKLFQSLSLPMTSARGVFGLPLELAGEKLPIG